MNGTPPPPVGVAALQRGEPRAGFPHLGSGAPLRESHRPSRARSRDLGAGLARMVGLDADVAARRGLHLVEESTMIDDITGKAADVFISGGPWGEDALAAVTWPLPA